MVTGRELRLPSFPGSRLGTPYREAPVSLSPDASKQNEAGASGSCGAGEDPGTGINVSTAHSKAGTSEVTPSTKSPAEQTAEKQDVGDAGKVGVEAAIDAQLTHG